MCEEVVSACREPIAYAFTSLAGMDTNFKTIGDYACDIFPDDSEDHCFIKNVTCAYPKHITNGVLNYAGGDSAQVHLRQIITVMKAMN